MTLALTACSDGVLWQTEFRAGFEASFLVLRDDPLADFRDTTGITMRVKRGRAVTSSR